MRLQKDIFTWVLSLVIVGGIFPAIFHEASYVSQPLQIELVLAEELDTPPVCFAFYETYKSSTIPQSVFPWSFSFSTYVAYNNALISISYTSAEKVYKPLPGFCFGRLQKTLPSEPSEAIAAIG